MVSLETTIGKVVLDNPLILASGIMGSTYSSLNRLYKDGFGAVTTKSIGLEKRKGHPNPSVIFLPEISSVMNAVGLANPGCRDYAIEIANIDSNVKFIVSVFGSSPKEISAVIECFENNCGKTQPAAFELNLSCPHAEKVGMAVGTDPVTVSLIVEEVKSITKRPVWVKLTPNIADITKVGLAAQSSGADAIVAINTLKAMIIDIKAKMPVLGNKRGGLSGKAIKPVGVRAIYDLYEILGKKVSLIGTGGISTWKDAIEYFLAGASAVQVGSALVGYPTPDKFVTDTLSGIKSYLEEENLSLAELRGLAHE
ncbi:MAG: dihydroorotate dehydrogenase [Candidatus Hodarchaeales archaeon]